MSREEVAYFLLFKFLVNCKLKRKKTLAEIWEICGDSIFKCRIFLEKAYIKDSVQAKVRQTTYQHLLFRHKRTYFMGPM